MNKYIFSYVYELYETMKMSQRCRISNAGRLRGGVASDALRRGTPSLRVLGRTQRGYDRSDVTGHQGIRTGRRQILPGETHQDRILGLSQPLGNVMHLFPFVSLFLFLYIYFFFVDYETILFLDFSSSS